MKRLVPVLAALAILFLSLPALAAEEAPGPAESPLGWTFRWLNFAVVLAALLYVCVRKAPAFFRGRAEQVASAIAEAARAREEAERRRAEAEARLAGVDREVAGLRAAAGRDAAAEAERIRAAAREEAGKVELAAQAEIDAAERAARMELKVLAARLAVERAESMIRAQIGPEAQAALLSAFVTDVERTA